MADNRSKDSPVPIDPFALVHPTARVAPDVQVGPFSVIEAGVRIGPGCRIASRVTLKAGLSLGSENVVEEGAVIGGLPQHLNRIENPGRIEIGDRNVLRENVTIHRPMEADGITRIGNDCLLMVGTHVAHDCQIGDRVVLTNNVMLAGHVTVGERVCMGGGAAIHQYCRVGRLAMVGGMARMTQDIPPFVTVDGASNLVVGLNRVGMRRAGLTLEQARDVKAAYQSVYRSGLDLEGRLNLLRDQFAEGPAAEFAPFLESSKRGCVRERRTPPSTTTMRVIHADDSMESPGELRKAG